MFRQHIEMLQAEYKMITPDEVNSYTHNNKILDSQKHGMLITFDDGLSDHFRAARILYEYNIKALFFVPTCVLIDNEPANPIIIHYCLAINRIAGFLKAFNNALEDYGLDIEEFCIDYQPRQDAAWDIIKEIKSTFKYKLHYKDSRKILLHIYKNTLANKHHDMMNEMHLSNDKVQAMLDMGHSIGVHSHSHISVAASDLTKEDFNHEIVNPRKYLKETFNTEIDSFSYPFGGKQDCLSTKALIDKTDIYDLAFTVETILNTKATSPHELGRYMPMSTDTAEDLKFVLNTIVNNSKED